MTRLAPECELDATDPCRPERRLLRAVLERAILDALGGIGAVFSQSARSLTSVEREAFDFLHCEDPKEPRPALYSALYICLHLDIDIEELRRRFREMNELAPQELHEFLARWGRKGKRRSAWPTLIDEPKQIELKLG